MKYASDLFQVIVEASPAAMFVVDAHGAIELVNAESERMFGYRRERLIGASIDLLTPASIRERHGGFRDDFAAQPQKRQMGVGRDLRGVRADGSEFPVEIGLTPVRQATGMKVLVVVVDITARREAEKANQDKVLEQERANASLAHFAFAASHDIQEPLRKIVSFSEILTQAIDEQNWDDLRLASSVMRSAALQARAMVADMLTLARSMNGAYQFETISLAEVVTAALRNLSRSIEETGARIELCVDPVSLDGDRQQAIRLVQNLVENALKYHKIGQAPRVAITATAGGTPMTRLKIQDYGIGFASHRREEIFEPFKRLHGRDEYPGSGLGLAICRTIATRHGWSLSAAGSPGGGACFEIAMPGDAERVVA